MNKAIFLVLFSITAFAATSQRIYFIYLQTESQQPFFVKLDEKIHSSTASGYLIVSRLKDSVYNFTVGFTGNVGGEQKFSCSINKKDHGYLVKNFGEKGWGLVDLQTASVQMAANDVKKDVSMINTPVNAFTELLSKAADDSTLRQKNVLPEEKKAEPVVAAAVIKKDEPQKATINKQEEKAKTDDTKTGVVVVPASTVIKQKEDKKETGMNKKGQKTGTPPETLKLEPQTPPPVNNTVSKKTEDTIIKDDEQKAAVAVVLEPVTKLEETFVRSKVVKKSESSTTEGFGLIYTDTYADGTQDTIRIVIPNDTKIQLADTGTKDRVSKNTSTEALAVVPAQNTAAPVKSKNTCKEVATDADFYKLRKKMASGKSDGDMLDEAKRSLKAKCFTTMQVKNLSTMFLGDGGKYNFFDAAYLHITDVENFAGLQSELKDEYFINRFKAMLH